MKSEKDGIKEIKRRRRRRIKEKSVKREKGLEDEYKVNVIVKQPSQEELQDIKDNQWDLEDAGQSEQIADPSEKITQNNEIKIEE